MVTLRALSFGMMLHVAAMAGAQPCSTFGAEGHWYLALRVPGGITWTNADAMALASGGYLASITSSAENQFVFSLIDKPEIWVGGAFVAGPWIGGIQPPGSPEPLGGWTWVSGEPFVFSAWTPGEPNNGGGLRQEDHICFWSISAGRSPTWNDYPWWANTPGLVIEWNADPRPVFVPGEGTATVICAGVDLQISAPMASTAPAVLRWRKNGAPLTNSTRISGTDSSTLSIAGVRLSDEGVYECVATHACGEAISPPTALTVCIADFNCSEGTPDDADVTAFFEAWNAGDPLADLNESEGTPDDADITLFFARWNQGC